MFSICESDLINLILKKSKKEFNIFSKTSNKTMWNWILKRDKIKKLEKKNFVKSEIFLKVTLYITIESNKIFEKKSYERRKTKKKKKEITKIKKNAHQK